MITAEIKLGSKHQTLVSAETIEEILYKIKEYHTMGDFERQHYTNRGNLKKELDSGWWFKGE